MKKNVQFARPKSEKNTTVATVPLFEDVAVDHIYNLLLHLPDPDSILTKAGINRSALRAMEGDDEIYQCLETRLDAILATSWHFEPASGSGLDTNTKFVWEILEPFIAQIITSAFGALPYGLDVQECVWKRDGKFIVPDYIKSKPFEWFVPQRNDTLVFMPISGSNISNYGTLTYGQIVDTKYKFFLTIRKNTYRNPYGEALLSRLYWPWYFRHNAWRFWMQFIERFGTPMLVGKSGNPEMMAEKLVLAAQDAVIAIGHEDSLNALSPANSGVSFKDIETALTRRIQKLILGQTLTSGTDGGSGNRALGTVHENVRSDKKHADLRLISTTIQRISNAIIDLNFGGKDYPVFTFEYSDGLAAERAVRDTDFVRYGVLKLSEQYLMNRYDYEPGDFIVPETTMTVGSSGGTHQVQTDSNPAVPGNDTKDAIQNTTDSTVSGAA